MNKVIISGNLTRDIELRKTPTGLSCVRFSLGVRRSSEKTDFVNCVAFDKTADYLANYSSKGDKLLVEGRLYQSSYEGKNGRVETYEVNASSVEVMHKNTVKEPTLTGRRDFVESDFRANKASDSLSINTDELPFY